MLQKITRRKFVKRMAMGAAAGIAPGVLQGGGAAERVRLGFIGVGNRGDQLLDAFLQQMNAAIRTGAVDERIDSTVLGFDPPNELLGRVRPRNIGLDADDPRSS